MSSHERAVSDEVVVAGELAPGRGRRRVIGVGLVMAVVSCGGSSTVRRPTGGAVVVHQVWDIAPDGDGCNAVPRCYGELSAPCDPAPTDHDEVVQFVPYACPAGGSKVQIGQRRDTRACVILPAGTEAVACPDALPSAWYPGEGGPVADEREPGDGEVSFSVSAFKNIEKGQEALAHGQLAAARAYFEFTLTRYPMSSTVHEAERGLLGVEMAAAKGGASGPALADATCLFVEHHQAAPQVVSGELRCPAGTIREPKRHADELARLDADADRAQAAGEIDVDTTNGYCLFIAHHPTFPQVANGDIACRVNQIQGTPCDSAHPPTTSHCPSP